MKAEKNSTPVLRYVLGGVSAIVVAAIVAALYVVLCFVGLDYLVSMEVPYFLRVVCLTLCNYVVLGILAYFVIRWCFDPQEFFDFLDRIAVGGAVTLFFVAAIAALVVVLNCISSVVGLVFSLFE